MAVQGAQQPVGVQGTMIGDDELSRIRSRYTRRSKTSLSHIIGRIGFWLLVAFIIIYTLFPFYWAIVSSLTPASDLYLTPVKFWPQNLTFEHYERVLSMGSFQRALINSAVVSLSVVLLALFFGTVGAYALGRLHFRGRTIILYLILSMTMFPGVAIIGSLFTLVRTLNVYNTLWALIITYLSFTLPFTIWVLTNFFKAMPGELEEAALVDGCTPLRALREILLPLAVPGMVTTGLLAFIGAWSEFLFALTFTLDESARTVQVAISQFSGNTQYEQPFAPRMAAAVVVTIPLLIGVLLVQRRIISGLTAGAVKG